MVTHLSGPFITIVYIILLGQSNTPSCFRADYLTITSSSVEADGWFTAMGVSNPAAFGKVFYFLFISHAMSLLNLIICVMSNHAP